MKKQIDIKDIKENKENPRFIKDKQFDKLVNSIKNFPEMLEKRPLVLDENNIVLGGNMRLKAIKKAGVKKVWVDIAKDWTENQKKEFIIKDNIGYGNWDWDILANEWDVEELEDWGLDLDGFNIDENDFDEDFSLDEKEKDNLQKVNFTLADEQINFIRQMISDIKKTEEFKYIETFGNSNDNGNALYLIVNQWVQQKK
jgi:ParB-like chromosome segregation protein Spo0J